MQANTNNVNKIWVQKNWQQGTQAKQKHNPICAEHHYVQTDTNKNKLKNMCPPTN